MFRLLLPMCVGVILVLSLRTHKESKNYRVNERNESLYIDTNGTIEEYINSNNLKTNKYEN